MKLSHITLGALLLAASVSPAQQDPKRPKSDTTKASAGSATVERKRPVKTKKAVKKDTVKTKTQTRPISPDYCPPCGMG